MNIAIVGCGSIAKVHAECIQGFGNHRLVAFADINLEKANQFAAQYKGNAYSSYENMLEKEEIEVLHICTPHYLHVPMAIYALEHGVHVFMEKPPVISREQLAELQKLSTDKQLGICFQNRYNPSVIKVKKVLESGKAGKICGARGIVTWNRMEAYYRESNWRGKLSTEGGGALINQSIHTLDLLAYFLGTPVSVDAVMANHHLKGIIEVEDMMEAFIRFKDGINACFYTTTAYFADVPPLIEIACENMTIRMEDLDVTYYYKDGKTEKPVIENRLGLGKSYWGAGHKDCIADFYDSILEKRPFALNLSTLLKTIQLMLGTYESARTGKEILL
jgi:UDP-N-acetyl-2-amino-2-deoxyglucuronate dehydrogenase